MRRILLFLVFLSMTLFVNAQNNNNVLAKQLVTKNAAAIGLSQDDLNNFIVNSSYFNQTSGTQMVYLLQGYKGLPVYNQMLVLAFKNEKLVSKTGEFLPNLESLINQVPSAKAAEGLSKMELQTSLRTANTEESLANRQSQTQTNLGSGLPSVSPEAAVRTAITEARVNMPAFVMVLKTLESGKKFDFGKLNIATENIIAELMWVPLRDGATMTGVRLAWQVQLFPTHSSDMWSIRVDANSNTVVDKNNYTVYDNFNHPDAPGKYLARDNMLLKDRATFQSQPLSTSSSLTDLPSSLTNLFSTPGGPSLVGTANYTVVRYPAESPIHPGGVPAVTTNPWLLAGGNAVTLGWHNDGAADYIYTRGNNVYAQEDRDNNNNTFGLPATSTTSPDPLNFTYPINFNVDPTTPDFQQFAITNLFYWNNILHDLNYKYGYDEPAGNFQNNNLGRGGLGNDYVIADAQDAGGLNNANFGTPPDGSRPRMQMFLWSPAPPIINMVVNTPPVIAGPYAAVEGQFSPANLLINVGPVTAQVIYYNDDAAATHEACVIPSNGAALVGKIALINRGNCNFTVKVKNAQDAGAVAVIMVNNAPGAPIIMGGGPDPSIIIPAVMISDVDGATIAAQLANNVNVTLSATGGGTVMLDGDLDNGIVAHEFFHGVSNRLTGGPATTSCLGNQEQGGEGWSDYMALMLTHDWSTALVTDGNNKPRGIGTYALGQPITGVGIRQYQYCTNIAINPLTYTNLPAQVVPHGVGTVWCTALWEMTWAIIQTDGINTNFFNNAGTGGNTVAFKIMMEGLKLQPCSPGFIDARNAILQADQNLYGGAHFCSIWAAFAKRGMGFSATQGSSNSITDQTPAFDLPPGASFTTQPTNTTTCVGSTATFTAIATGATYQWQVSTTGVGGPFVNIPVGAPYSGITTQTLTINPAAIGMNGYAYRCVATTLCGSSNSNAAVLTVVAAAVGGTVTPANASVCAVPNSTLLTLTGNVGPVTQWESSTVGCAGPWTPIAGTAGQQTYTATNVAVTTYYRAFISAVGCASAGSSCATITVIPGSLPIFIVADPGTTVCAGDPTRLTVMEGIGTTAVNITASSDNNTITTNNGISCGTPVTTAVNSFWRVYPLTSYPAVTGNYTISSVRFGVEVATGGPQNVIVNLYNQTGAAFPGGTRTLIPGGTVTVSVPNTPAGGSIITATFAVPPTVLNTQTIVVEIQTTGAVGTRYFPGSNTAAEASPSYLSAVACAFPAPVTFASIGFPNCHIIAGLQGSVQGSGSIVVGGTFLWSPAAGLSSTSTNPVAAAPATTTTYTVQHNNGAGCIRTAQITINVNTRPTITTNPSNVSTCNASTATFTAAGTGTGLTYQWQFSTDNGATWNNVPAAAPYTGTQTATLTINPVSAAMNGYRYRMVLSGTCPPGVPGTPNISTGAILTVIALPTVTITPPGPLCGGVPGVNGVMLTTGGGVLPPIPGTQTVSSGAINLAVPDNTANGVSNVINMAGVPANATITNITVTFNNFSHTYPGDIIAHLKAPNGTVLNLYKYGTGLFTGASSGVPTWGWYGANVSMNGAIAWSTVAAAPFIYNNSTNWKADLINTPVAGAVIQNPTGFTSTATAWNQMYTTGGSTNGGWTLAMCDGGPGDVGTLTSWDLKIDYTTPNPAVPISYTWSPAAGLYTDPNATIPYIAGTQTPTVYAAPTTNTVYTVTALENSTGCTNTATVTVNYTPAAPTVNPTSAAMCLGDAAIPLTITSSLAPTTVTLTNSTPVAIPDNTANGVQSVINVAGVPVGAVISSMAVTLNMSHTYPADMVFNLRAPNGQILNLYKHNTNTNNGAASEPTAGFFNAVVNSTGTVVFSTVPAPYRYGITAPVGPFRPDALNGAIVNPGYTIMDPAGFASTAANFAALYSTPNNGAWTLAMCDGGPADLGTLQSWTLSFTYGTPTVGIWTPNGAGSGLYTDPGATTIYTGTPVQTVYAMPGVSTTYSVTVSTATCTSPVRLVPVTVNTPIAIGTVSANQAVCTDKVATFTVTATGTSATYQWQVSTNGGNTWTDIANGGVYSGATTATLVITAPPVSMNGYFYRVIVSGAAPCAAVTSAQRLLTVNPLPTVVISASPYTRLLPGLFTTLSSVVTPNSAAPGGYSWLRDGVQVPGSTGTLSVGVDGLGNYSLRVTDIFGCTSTSNVLAITDSVSGKCFIYPNPNNGTFQVRYYSALNNVLPRTLTVYDAKGEQVLTKMYTIGRPYDRMDVDLRRNGKGLYWVEIGDANGKRLTMCRVAIQ